MTRSMIRDARRLVVQVVTATVFLSCRFGGPTTMITEEGLVNHFSGICEPSYSCECRGAARRFYDEDNTQCHAMLETWVIDAQAAGLVYSKACAEDLWGWLVEFLNGVAESCPTDAAHGILSIACEDECQIYSGTAELGEACERFGRRMSTCAAHLTCGFDGRCHSWCDQPVMIPAGGTCGYAAGLLEAQCEQGLLCDAGTQTCVVQLVTGASCDADASLCPPEDWCSRDTETCIPRLPLGAACRYHEECATAVCDEVCQTEDMYQCDHPWF